MNIATGQHLVARAVVSHRTASTTHADITVRDERDRLVATATATSRLFG